MPTSMYNFHAADWFHITGRGWVATFMADQIPAELHDPGLLVNQLVTIDDKVFRVSGVEKSLILISPNRPYRLPFGLLTRPFNSVEDSPYAF